MFCTPKANAFNKYDGGYAGARYGEAACQAIWSNARTKKEAFEKAVNYIEYQSIIEDINMVLSLSSKYGNNHPIVNSFYTRMADEVIDNCVTEYDVMY